MWESMREETRRRHPQRALTARAVQTARAGERPRRIADGGGLYLLVVPGGAKSWVLRTVVQGRRCDIGLGGVTLVPLVEAREQALRLRKIARAGGDPLAERRAEIEILCLRKSVVMRHDFEVCLPVLGKETDRPGDCIGKRQISVAPRDELLSLDQRRYSGSEIAAGGCYWCNGCINAIDERASVEFNRVLIYRAPGHKL